VDNSAAAGIAGLIGGASGGYRGAFEQALDEATQILFKRGYAQADELEADRLGLILATLAGYDPKAFLIFLERAERFEPTQGSTGGDHLQHTQRIDVLQALLTTQGMSTPEGFQMKRRFHANLSR
jgi:predicted Zn-dependent protease